jgi:hypothetical protein
MALAIIVILADVVFRIIHPRDQILSLNDDDMLQRYFPMACLLIITSAYFAGRAVDYTLVIALLPFCAIAIPAFFFAVRQSKTMQAGPTMVAALPTFIIFWGLTVCFASFYRSDSPYASLIRECREQCSPSSLENKIKESLSYRPWFDSPRIKSTLAEDKTRIVRNTVELINRWAPDQPNPIVLLEDSNSPGLSETAFMYSGKWDRWPRSFAPVDQIVPKLLARILAAPVRLMDGDIAIVHVASDGGGPLEKGILDRVRAKMTMCRLPGSGNEVAAYRLTSSSQCEVTPDNGGQSGSSPNTPE